MKINLQFWEGTATARVKSANQTNLYATLMEYYIPAKPFDFRQGTESWYPLLNLEAVDHMPPLVVEWRVQLVLEVYLRGEMHCRHGIV